MGRMQNLTMHPLSLYHITAHNKPTQQLLRSHRISGRFQPINRKRVHSGNLSSSGSLRPSGRWTRNCRARFIGEKDEEGSSPTSL